MKRVLVSIYIDPEFYPPTKNAIFELASNTEKVIVLTRNLFESNLGEYPENVRFVKVGRFMTVQESEKTSFVSKIWVFLLFWISYQRIVLTSKIDTVIFYDSIPLFIFLIGIKLSKIAYWYHNHDMPDLRFIRKYSIGWFSAKYEHFAMNKIDYFSLPSMDRLVYYPNWTKKESFFYIPNFPSKSKFENLSLQNRFEKFTIIFQGHIGPGHGIEQFIKIMQKVKDVKLLLVGPINENYQIELEELAKKYNSFDNLEILGRIPYDQLIKLSSMCHLGIAIYDGNDAVSKTVGTASNKIYEYLACGMPIILSEKEQFIKTLGFESFCFYHNNEIEKLSQIIEGVKLDFKQLSEKARSTFLEKYTFESSFSKVLNYLNAK